MNTNKYQIYSDGGARGNPGPAASGFVILKDKKEIDRGGSYLGETTNNVAEYQAALEALEKIISLKIDDIGQITAYLDSQLVVKQLKGEYKINQEHLKQFVFKIHEIISQNHLTVNFIHIKREYNKVADSIVNQILDSQA